MGPVKRGVERISDRLDVGQEGLRQHGILDGQRFAAH